MYYRSTERTHGAIRSCAEKIGDNPQILRQNTMFNPASVDKSLNKGNISSGIVKLFYGEIVFPYAM